MSFLALTCTAVLPQALGPLVQHIEVVIRRALQRSASRPWPRSGTEAFEAQPPPLPDPSPNSPSVVRIANLMGSHGSKAVAMAALGRRLGLVLEPTVVDVSEGQWDLH